MGETPKLGIGTLMKNSLSVALAIAFSVSNWAALACGATCNSESRFPAEHLGSLHFQHAHSPGSEPVVSASHHPCGNHGVGEAVFSPKRVIQLDKLTVLIETPSPSLQDHVSNSGMLHERLWQSGFPRSQPQSISLRI